MDNQKFYDGAPEEIKKILKEQYGMNDGNKRNSETHKDNKVLEHICDKYSNKFMGYGANEMNTFFSHMHAEIALCKKYIGNVRKIGPVSLTQSQENDYKRNNMEHQGRERRKNTSKRIRHLSPISPPSLNTKSPKVNLFKSFGDESYESPPSSPRRQLFSGGKTSNRRKRTPKKKTRKNKPHKPNKPNKQNRPHKN